jgi:general secretion pathway protein K
LKTQSPAKMTGQPNRETGVALVLVLWVLTLLGIIATSFSKSMRTETELARQLTLSAQARALAEAGIYRGILDLLRFRRDPQAKWQANGTVYKVMKLGRGEIRIAIQDEAGRVDLNTAQKPVIEGLLRGVGVDDQARAAIPDAIIDWRDPDNLRQLQGAEDEDYQAAGRSYGAKDGLFNCVEELQQVLGMTPALYRKLAPLLTVHSHRPNVDINLAPPALVQVLEASEAAQAGVEPTNLGAPASNRDPSRSDFSPPRGGLRSSGGSTFTLRAYAKVYDTLAEIAATIKLGGDRDQPYSVIAWNEWK